MKKLFQIFIIVGFLLKASLPGFAQDAAYTSVLAEGKWFKIGVIESGVYKINYNFLKNSGLLAGTTNPGNIKIFGNGGGMLPQKNNAPRANDLVENAIFVAGAEDGKFDKDDYILFYAQGPHEVEYDLQNQYVKVIQNIYSDTSYYFITVSDGDGKRIQTAAKIEGGETVSFYDDFIYHEKDQINILADIETGNESGSGREWFGDRFDTNTNQDFSLDLTNLNTSFPVKVYSSVLGSSSSSVSFSLKLNNVEVGTHSIPGIVAGRYNIKGVKDEKVFETVLAPSTDLKNSILNYSFSGMRWGFLNFYTVTFKRNLFFTDEQFSFRSFNSLDNVISRFQISGLTSNSIVWEITDPLAPHSLEVAVNGESGEFSSETNQLKEFVVFNPDKVDAPFLFGQVANQNLHAIGSTGMIIISHPNFLPAAERLASFRSQKSGIAVTVVTTSQIYNEFSSGKQDVTAIRDFLRTVYLKDRSLKYVLLFGDCSYDYKNRVKGNTNFVPVYESRESLHPIRSYSSDDYFGFMDEEEGDWIEDSNGDHDVELGIGRIPATTLKEGEQIVDKIIAYSNNPKNLGNWRNNVTFVSDDGDANTHLFDAERLAALVDTTADVKIKKIHLASFPQLPPPQNTSPVAKKTLDETIKLGTLILNYTGHGSASVLADERILDVEQVAKLNNKDRLPLIVTATCDFGKYDNPRLKSGAEIALSNPRGGAIALITTTRPVFSSTNFILNRALYQAAFLKIENRMPTLGDIIKYTKNNSLNGSINRNFALLGDPSLTLAYPEHEVEVLSVNGKALALENDTLRALSEVKMEGIIKNREGRILSDFNGVVELTIFDKYSDNKTVGDFETPVTTYSAKDNVIFKGNFSVTAGAFSVSFRLPKNINYQPGNAFISLYAYDSDNLNDATGSLRALIIGGSETNYPIDDNPPEIALYLNDTTFKSGHKVAENPVLIAKLSDESGINITRTAVGQDLVAYLDFEEQKEFVLNDFFQPEIDNYKAGSIVYPLYDLKQGKYTLTLKAWDTYNNSSQRTIEFTVAKNLDINISRLFNFPNPFTSSEGTTFSFSHDRLEEDIELSLNIYSVKGDLIKTMSRVIYKSDQEIMDLKWDGKDQSGSNIPTGVYIYRLEIRSLSNKNKGVKSERLVIIN